MVAAQRGRRVLVVDHARQAGEKILISGGGRCNFTNTGCVAERFFSDNPHFARSALARYTPRDFVELVERHRIAWHEKTLGQLFCDGSARQIVDMLLAECARGGAEVRVGVEVGEVGGGEGFRVEVGGRSVRAGALVLATGGLSIPKIGASGLAYRLAGQFGLAMVPTRPGLVGLTLGEATMGRLRGLAGVSTRVVAQAGRARFEEGMVVTHRGVSGPAILQVSSAWRDGEAVAIDLVPAAGAGFLVARKRGRPKAGLRALLGEVLPQRLADAFLPAHRAAGSVADVPDRELAALEAELRCWRLHPSGTEGYVKAEVTLGGIATQGLDQRTMQARGVPGLFAIGEAVDVTGWLGGYNFQWAWASGFAAGEAV